jgi:hypothetical protein
VSDTTTTRYAADTPRSITYLRLDQLKAADRNPRKHDLPKLVAAIARHGFTVPILVCERRQEIAAGHGRWKALWEMYGAGDGTPTGILVDDDAMWLVPVLRGWASRDDSEFEQYLVNDTKLAQSGGWDDRLLAAILDDLTSDAPDLFDELAMTHEDLDSMLRTVDPELLGEQDPDKPGRPDPLPDEAKPAPAPASSGDPIPAGQGTGTDPMTDPVRSVREPGELPPDRPDDPSAHKKTVCPSCHHRFVPGDRQFKSGSRARSEA